MQLTRLVLKKGSLLCLLDTQHQKTCVDSLKKKKVAEITKHCLEIA